jgi:hypothetical protein
LIYRKTIPDEQLVENKYEEAKKGFSSRGNRTAAGGEKHRSKLGNWELSMEPKMQIGIHPKRVGIEYPRQWE